MVTKIWRNLLIYTLFNGGLSVDIVGIETLESRAVPINEKHGSVVTIARKRRVLAGLWLILVVQIGPPSQAVEYRIGHCLFGCPQGANSANHLIIRSIYALSYNTTLKSAEWAAYRVTADSIGIASSLSRQAVADDFEIDTLRVEDFEASEGIGLVLSQLVPLVNFAGTPYWGDANYMSNIVPRSRSLSRGAWYGLEWAVRNLVNKETEVFVLSGPIFNDPQNTPQLRTSVEHRVPDAFFKIIVTESGQASAFILAQNVPVHRHHCELRTDIAEIEEATGLRFFPEAQYLDFTSLDASLGCSES